MTANPVLPVNISAVPPRAEVPATLTLPPPPEIPCFSAWDRVVAGIKWMLLIAGAIILSILLFALIRWVWNSMMTSAPVVVLNTAPPTGSLVLPASSIPQVEVVPKDGASSLMVPAPKQVQAPQMISLHTTGPSVNAKAETKFNPQGSPQGWPTVAKQRHALGYNPVWNKFDPPQRLKDGILYGTVLTDATRGWNPDPEIPQVYLQRMQHALK